MPKNTKGGKKHNKLKNSNIRHQLNNVLTRDSSGLQHYAVVEKSYGHTADVKYIFERTNDEGDAQESTRTLVSSKAIIRGSIAKKCKLSTSDILLISMREFDKTKVDIIYKYSPDELKQLLHDNELEDDFVKLINSFDQISKKSTNTNVTLDDIINETNNNDIIFNDNANDDLEDEINYELDDIDY